MRPFVAAYVTTDGKEWDRPLCVEQTLTRCKEDFCAWYQSVNHQDCSVRYAFVTVVECDEVEE
jgi:hypothetical protein